jgi:effector-binding domain-containing protein
MKLLKILLYIALSLTALICVLGLFAKHDYHIERSIEIDAPHAVVMEQVQLFKNFAKWSPWNSLDPNMKETFEGTDGQPGAVYKWEGNDDVGSGQQTIKTVSADRVDIEVKLKEPWETTVPSFFKLEPVGNNIKVSWAIDFYIGFPWNGMAMFTDVNAGVGKDYERGLNNLKKVCEDIAHPKYRGYAIEELPADAQYFVGVRRTIKQEDVAAFYAEIFPKVLDAVQKSGVQLTGAPSSLTYLWDDSTKTADIAAVFPIAKAQKIDTFTVFTLPASNQLLIDYYGHYDSIGVAHLAMEDYMKLKTLEMLTPCLEQYITDPAAEPDNSKWLTKVHYFVKPKQAAPTPKK